MLSSPETVEQSHYLRRETLLYMWKVSDTDVETQQRVCIKPGKINSPIIINHTNYAKQQRVSRLTPNIHGHNSRSNTSQEDPQQTPMRDSLCKGRISVGAFKIIITHPSEQYYQMQVYATSIQ